MSLYKTVAALVIISFALGVDCAPNDAYEYLIRIESFYKQFHQRKLKSYSADLELSGSIADMIFREVSSHDLSPIKFQEFYKYPNTFTINIPNEDYPPLLKQIFVGMVSPVKVFNRIIETLENKRTSKWLTKFQKETRAAVSDTLIKGKKYTHLTFVPREKIFDTREITKGRKKIFEWSEEFHIVLDRKYFPYSIRLKTGKTEIGSADTTRKTVTMHFKFKKFGKNRLPVNLSIITGKGDRLNLAVFYKKQKKYYVFDKRIFSLPRQDSKNKFDTLVVSYQNYKINKKVGKDVLAEKPINLNHTEIQKLYQEAENLLLDGRASVAKKKLKKIIKEYPDSEYAKRAKHLLDGLP
jgi:hypothetical protein